MQFDIRSKKQKAHAKNTTVCRRTPANEPIPDNQEQKRPNLLLAGRMKLLFRSNQGLRLKKP